MRRAYDDYAQQPGLDERIARLAASQHGAFTRDQAMSAGGTKDAIHRRVKRGRWERIAPRVYRVAGSVPTWRQSVLVACLAWGDRTAASHRGGAPLWRIAGFDPGPVELTVPRNRHRAGPGLVHRGVLAAVDVTVLDSIPVTTPARTLIDLASVVPFEMMEEALDDALRRRIVSISRMRWRLDALARPGRPGIAAMRRLLNHRDPSAPVPDSVFERRLLGLLRRARLPEPILHHAILDDRGRLAGIVDFAYPEARLAIEADGFRWHSGRVPWERDRARLNRLTLLGWRIIHVTWTNLTTRPAEVVGQIRDVLTA
ncbi:MAG TPA: type IV toxin-antitoxin system AbiEi family antitoxin domain-containing protein [Actinomycetota bacterium]|nr:type IV toxin-antitoxin system AbiEi family antitoxin domain-containing protein [Actinomycetota bacterium]